MTSLTLSKSSIPPNWPPAAKLPLDADNHELRHMRLIVQSLIREIVNRRTSLIGIFLLALFSPCVAQDTSLESALKAAKWLDTAAIQTKDGIVWPSDPRDAKSVNTTLYAGTPGPILFFLELY